MSKLFLSIVIYFSLIFISFADHGPNKMWKRQIVPYFDVHETKMMGPFKINVHAYGKKMNLDADSVKKEGLSLFPNKVHHFFSYYHLWIPPPAYYVEKISKTFFLKLRL